MTQKKQQTISRGHPGKLPPWGQGRVLAVAACAGLVLGACGNRENPVQTAAALSANASVPGKGTDPGKPVDQSPSRSVGDERYVAFQSAEPTVLEGDTNRVTDVFVYDRHTKQTTRVSVSNTGAQANGGSFAPEATRDGRLVVFESLATNLVPDDTNRQRDVFVHDRQSGKTSRVSVDSTGSQANNFSQAAHLSEDGRYVAFESLASNLVSSDTNGVIDIFVHDRQTKRAIRVSVASGGAQANNMSVNASISADGRYVTFESFATNLSSEKTDGPKQTFIHDRQTGQTIKGPTDLPTTAGAVNRKAYKGNG
ncbi:MAG: hypothetical protein ABIR36_17180 [Nitrospiraceae bacterium]